MDLRIRLQPSLHLQDSSGQWLHEPLHPESLPTFRTGSGRRWTSTRHGFPEQLGPSLHRRRRPGSSHHFTRNSISSPGPPYRRHPTPGRIHRHPGPQRKDPDRLKTPVFPSLTFSSLVSSYYSRISKLKFSKL